MRALIRKIFDFKFKILTILYLKLNRIEVIAVTGSAGKTSAKAALKQLLPISVAYVPETNYNTEIGVPMAIFGEEVPEKINSLGAWIKILFSMFGKVFKKAPYKRIVLELSADKMGDIKYLTSFIKPKISIVTTVLPVHLLEFKTIENIAKEKGYLAERTKKGGTVILNADNRYVKQMRNRTKAKVVMVGESEGADIKWRNVRFDGKGMTFELLVRGQSYRVKTKLIAPQLIPSLVSALAAGIALNVDIRDLITGIEKYVPEKGRMNILAGINGSTIIDDSYNANPASMKAALAVLRELPGRKIAALGSMKELGGYEKKGHQEVVNEALTIVDKLIISGDEMNKHAKPKRGRMNKKIVQFENSVKAGAYLAEIIEKGDVVLVKGSQGAFMEEASKQILANPARAGELLVRQSKMWEDKKEFLRRNDA